MKREERQRPFAREVIHANVIHTGTRSFDEISSHLEHTVLGNQRESFDGCRLTCKSGLELDDDVIAVRKARQRFRSGYIGDFTVRHVTQRYADLIQGLNPCTFGREVAEDRTRRLPAGVIVPLIDKSEPLLTGFGGTTVR